MAKRCFYEVLSVERTATDGEHQVRISQACDAMASGSQSGRQRGRASFQGGQRGLRNSQGPRQARSLRPFRARCLRAWRRRRGPRLRRRLRDNLLRHLRRSLRHGRPSRPRLRARARRRFALQYGNLPAGGFCRQGRANSHPDIGNLRGVLRFRRQARHQAEGLLDMRRTGKSPSRAGLFHARTHLSELSRPWPGRSRVRASPARAPVASCASGRCR